VDVVDKFDRFSSQILDDLIARAKLNEANERWMGLFVHPNNLAAIRLYERHAFKLLKKVRFNHKEFETYYPAMLLDLETVQVD
jgi:ribosomal protein S18 acetylase RimI-like enzyme